MLDYLKEKFWNVLKKELDDFNEEPRPYIIKKKISKKNLKLLNEA